MPKTAAAASNDEPQHLVALARANRIRLARAALKRSINDGESTVSEVLTSVPSEAASMTVADLLACQRRWGVTRCRRFLAASRISETRVVGTLTERQRNELIDRLAGETTLTAVRS
jgi:hypothetical protein